MPIAYVLIPVLCLVALAAADTAPERMQLWPDRAPTGDGGSETSTAGITIHRPAQANGAAVIICPGGGYGVLCVQPEGHGIATWLNRHGITGIVLEYRLPKGRNAVPLLDAQRALRLARANAVAWGIDTKRIGIMGFSAGGHLASTAATHADDGDATASDPVQRLGCRPDFQVLIYPVITLGAQGHGGTRDNLLGKGAGEDLVRRYCNELQVDAHTPPAYLAHALDDQVVPIANSRMYVKAMEAQHLPVRLLELAQGGHGLNGYKGPSWDAWQSGCLTWMAERKLIPEAAAR